MKIKGCKKESFIEAAIKNGGQPIFYLLRCYSKDEEFYKLGITVNHLMIRYGTPKAMPYEFEILVEHPDTAEAIYDLEVQYKTEMESFHYQPKILFNGSKTECYTNLSVNLFDLMLEHK
jgi:hypothetical protein